MCMIAGISRGGACVGTDHHLLVGTCKFQFWHAPQEPRHVHHNIQLVLQFQCQPWHRLFRNIFSL